MSQVAQVARRLAGGLLGRGRRMTPPRLAEVERALKRVRELTPADSADEIALQEAGETLLRLRDEALAQEQAG